MSSNGWIVYISSQIISWIRARDSEDGKTFAYYVREIEAIRNMTRSMGSMNYYSCGEGFKVYVEEEDVVLRCAYFMKEKQIHIVDTLPLK